MTGEPLDAPPVPDYAALHRLDGRVFVLLGAGNGIGRQTAHALTAAGARVLCVDVDAERARAVASETGGIAHTADITRRAEVRDLFAYAQRELGPLGVVVDIVGMARYAPLAELDDEAWDWHFSMVLRHAWLTVQYGGEALADAGSGPMVFVASVSGLTAAPLHAAYGAAKAGLVSLVRSAAVEYGPRGVRVNAVAPGVVWTPRVAALIGPRGPRTQRPQRPVGPRRRDLGHRVDPALLRLAALVVRHRADARRGRRGRREVPVPDRRRRAVRHGPLPRGARPVRGG